MTRIHVGRYDHPEEHGWAGYVHPEREEHPIPEWCLFITREGRTALGVKGDDGGLRFATDGFGPDHPRTFTREEGEPIP